MTNEQLAALAQDPDNAELVPVLWEKVKNLLYQKAGTVYNARKSRFQQCGVELWDIRQGCYMAFLEALKGFHPGAGNQFTSYLNYPFRNVVAELTRSRSTRKEPLNLASSIDAPIVNTKQDDSTTLAELLPDDTIDLETDVLEQIERQEESQLIHEAVNRLPERLREVIEWYYFQGLTLEEIAQRRGCSYQNIAAQKRDALHNLRRCPILQQIRKEYEQHYRWTAVQRREYQPDYFWMVQQCREYNTKRSGSRGCDAP